MPIQRVISDYKLPIPQMMVCIVGLYLTILTMKNNLLRKKGRGNLSKPSSSTPSWKQNHPSTLLSNSVEKSERAVKQVMSHPEEIALENAFNTIAHSENALDNAEQRQEHLDVVTQNKEKLYLLKQQLQEIQETIRNQN